MTTADTLVYTSEEQQLAIASLLRLNNYLINEFLDSRGVRKGNTKAEINVRVTDAIEAGIIKFSDIFTFLNPIECWGRQHVILLDGPSKHVEQWRNGEWVNSQIGEKGFQNILNVELPLALPKDLTLSSIKYDRNILRITAVERREGEVRDPEADFRFDRNLSAFSSEPIKYIEPASPYSAAEQRSTDDTIEETIFYKAFRYQVYRGIISFEWDLVANQAALQISQLPSGETYEDAKSRFEELISGLLELGDFTMICLRSVIARLHEMEEKGQPEAMSKGIAYKTIQGRTIEGKSAGGNLGLFGESVVDTTMSTVRKVSVGHTGNFYWLPPDVNVLDSPNPLANQLHVILNGEAKRCNFPVFSPESHIRYVLQRIRAIASGSP